MTETASDLITTQEAADLIDSSYQFVRRKVAAGEFPAPYVMGPRKIRHSRRAVLQWLEVGNRDQPEEMPCHRVADDSLL
jgi:excisionase family DNA binding protein